MMTRREILAYGVGALGTLKLSKPALASSHSNTLTLEARPSEMQLAPSSHPMTNVWGYDGRVPGPEIRVGQGQRLERKFINNLPQASTIHWHGIRIDNAMDGVPGLTQDAVPSGGSFDYNFSVPDAGTYWYHAHEKSTEQVARGLYGPLIVEESEPPVVDRDEVLVLDDWRLDPETAQIAPNFESRHDRSHAGRLGNFVVTNGRYDLSFSVRKHERLRLRLINAANARIFQLALSGIEGWVMALDGMPLEMPRAAHESFIMGPGQRVDLIVDVVAEDGDTAHLLEVRNGEGFSNVAFPVSGRIAEQRRAAPGALPPNPLMAVSGLTEAQIVDLHMAGGAMGSLESATFDKEQVGFREMVDANQFWALNGTVGMTEAPLVHVDRNQTVRLEIFNDSVFPHAMHLHGMHFREVFGDGTLGHLQDTLLMLGGQTREIAFMAHNPGDWLLHCHMLGHAASGMMTWLKVG